MQVAAVCLTFTCLYALASSIHALSVRTYPDDATSLIPNHLIRVLIYILTLISTTISLWEVYHNYFGGGSASSPIVGY